ncbi:MAG: hypothetical protein CVV47_01045 [Spirochaetae bacterium HGW-Spirochaetae-3]|jgi:simple sugar transport system permease protein|nr:MAG: hypothetical protein CVV47_01045 [Spirochaetae bacterium HGW-Spirochaetae-3]
MIHLSALLLDAIAFLAVLAPAAIGGLATEYAGSLNIALEGLMLAGAFSYMAFGAAFGTVAGFIAAMLVPSAIAYVSDLFSRKANADSFVVGLGVNMLVPAAASMLSKYVFGSKGVAAVAGLQSGRPFAGAASIPVVGALFGQRSSDYLAFGVAIMVALVLARTPLGTRAKAAGMNRDALTMAGIDSGGVRGAVYALSGLACGISGAALASSVGAWVPNMSAGRGWIALVAVYLGGKRLGGTFAASALFALLLSLATRAQAITEAPAELLLSLPYFLTAVVVVLGSSRSKRK